MPAAHAISGWWRDLGFSARLERSGAGRSAPPLRSAWSQNGEAHSLESQHIQHQALTACTGPHHHAVVATRPACGLAIESCLTTSTAATQLQTTPCPPPSSKVKVLERREHRQARSNCAASSAARRGRASSSSTESWKPMRDREQGGGRVLKEADSAGIRVSPVTRMQDGQPRLL